MKKKEFTAETLDGIILLHMHVESNYQLTYRNISAREKIKG